MYRKNLEAADRDFFIRALDITLRLSRRPDQPSLDKAVLAFRKALLSGAGPDEMDLALQDLKNETVSAELGGFSVASEEGSAGHISAEEKLEAQCFSELKTVFLNLLGQMEQDLGENYLVLNLTCREKISRARDLNEILDYRHDLTQVVQTYGQLFFDERGRAATFVSEVASRLAEVEQYLLSSMQHVHMTFENNKEFNISLGKELKRTAASIKMTDELESMKKLVMSKLSTIGEAIKQKQQKDVARMKAAGSDLGDFREKFQNIQEEVSRVQEENKTLMNKLKLDHLTGALNRLAYEEYLFEELTRFHRYRHPFSILLFDLDAFKTINDTHGHLAGDNCLKAIVRDLKTVLRGNDILGRYGGDEFIVILPETSQAAAAEVGEKTRQFVESTTFLVRGEKIPMTISLGVTTVKDTDCAVEDVIQRADEALYKAKQDGRNRVNVI